jgi:hypothetical protein
MHAFSLFLRALDEEKRPAESVEPAAYRFVRHRHNALKQQFSMSRRPRLKGKYHRTAQLMMDAPGNGNRDRAFRVMQPRQGIVVGTVSTAVS